MMDLGRTMYLMFKGAVDEGATIKEALMVVAAFSEGQARATLEDKEEPSDNDPNR